VRIPLHYLCFTSVPGGSPGKGGGRFRHSWLLLADSARSLLLRLFDVTAVAPPRTLRVGVEHVTRGTSLASLVHPMLERMDGCLPPSILTLSRCVSALLLFFGCNSCGKSGGRRGWGIRLLPSLRMHPTPLSLSTPARFVGTSSVAEAEGGF